MILDANISITMTWDDLDFWINPDNIMIIQISGGIVTGTCNHATVLEVTFQNITGVAILHTVFEKSTQRSGFYIEIQEVV